MQPGENPSRRRRPAGFGFALGVILVGSAVLHLIFGGAILNRCGKWKVERAFAEAHPGYVLRIGDLDYSIGANRLVARSVTLRATNLALKADRVLLTGGRWVRLWWGMPSLADVLAEARLEMTNLEVDFPQAHYGIRCARLRASVPGSELIAEGIELRTLVGEEEFFAGHNYRTTRFHVIVPECRILGLAVGELLQGKSYRARAIYFSRPSFDALLNRDKPVAPFVKRPPMVHEALAAIRQPLQVDNLRITNGHLTYRERVVAGADPGVVTFSAISISVEGIANRGEASAAILIRAQGDFMDATTLKLLMSIPITPPDFSLHYSGSLGAMDLTRLDAFLENAEHTRIKSGRAQEVAFDIDVTAGQARGRVRAIYDNLEFAFLDKQTGSEKGLDHRVASFLANELKFRSSNTPDAAGTMKEGKVDYTRRPGDEFQQFVWFALRSGAQDVVSQ
jgi:hypothetical protein